jgi:hypothetical protein
VQMLEEGRPLSHELHQVTLGALAAGAFDDERHAECLRLRVRHSDHAGLEDVRVLQQQRLNLGRRHEVEHVLVDEGQSLEHVDVALVVEKTEIACVHPAVWLKTRPVQLQLIERKLNKNFGINVIGRFPLIWDLKFLLKFECSLSAV